MAQAVPDDASFTGLYGHHRKMIMALPRAITVKNSVQYLEYRNTIRDLIRSESAAPAPP